MSTAGTFEVLSEQGKGTTFELSLPKEQPATNHAMPDVF